MRWVMQRLVDGNETLLLIRALWFRELSGS